MARGFEVKDGVRATVSGGDYEGKTGTVIGESDGKIRVRLDGDQSVVTLDKGDLGKVKEVEYPAEESVEEEPAEETVENQAG